MGRFTNSKYTQVVNSLTSAIESKINNPYYKFSDKKPTTVIYYKQNREKSTLDPDSGTAYQHVGEHSPFKYNKINNFLLYGMGRIELNYEVGDYGLESGEITGDAVILPNTIIPTQGDFFYVPYINEDVLFKVNSITPDTLDNGSNFYRIEYKLELINCREQIEKQVVETYEFIAANIGTDFQCILKSGSYDLVNQLEGIIGDMTKFYMSFFDQSVQTFVYMYNGEYMYDPYMVEFMIRTKIMSYSDEYFYITQAMALDKMFDYEYTKSFFYGLENGSVDIEKISTTGIGIKIEDPNSLFVTRLEDYYYIDLFPKVKYATRFNTIDIDVLEHIGYNSYYDETDPNYAFNLWVAYLNGDNDYIQNNILSIIDGLDYKPTKEYFYLIPVLMYILTKYIESIMR